MPRMVERWIHCTASAGSTVGLSVLTCKNALRPTDVIKAWQHCLTSTTLPALNYADAPNVSQTSLQHLSAESDGQVGDLGVPGWLTVRKGQRWQPNRCSMAARMDVVSWWVWSNPGLIPGETIRAGTRVPGLMAPCGPGIARGTGWADVRALLAAWSNTPTWSTGIAS